MYIACYNVYNEREHLPESVKSVYDKVDRIIFVDGRYKGFYDDKPVASTDGTVQWIKNKKNDPKGKFELVKAPKKPWAKQADKRNQYLQGEEGDVYLQIDGHEVVEDFKGFSLLLNDVGFARIDLAENAIPISVKQPRVYAHKKGLKHITHAYLITEDEGGGNQKLFLNMAWDQQTVLPIKTFTEKVSEDSYCLTLRHIGPQRTELEQRKKQADTEKKQVHIFDNEHGLDFKVDARVAVDRLAERLHEHYKTQFPQRGWPVPSFALVRAKVADFAQNYAKKQKDMKKYRGLKDDNLVRCTEPGCTFEACFLDMITHVAEKHKKAAS